MTTMTTTATTTSASSNSKSETKSSSSSIWSDLPKRLLTVCVGFPLICYILSIKQLAHIFFVCVHAIASYEWGTFLVVSSSSSSNNNNDDDDDNDNKHNKKQQQRHHYCRVAFCITSLLLAWIESDILFQLSLMILVGTIVILSVVVVANNKDDASSSEEKKSSSSSSSSSISTISMTMTIVGYIFLTIPMRCWYYISTKSFPSTICILLTVWNCDTGALLFGRITSTILLSMRMKQQDGGRSDAGDRTNANEKKRRLLPIPNWILKVSPSKSMEGFLGGIVGGCLTTMYLIPWMYNHTSLLTPSTYANNSIISKFITSLLTWNNHDETCSSSSSSSSSDTDDDILYNEAFVTLWITTSTTIFPTKFLFGVLYSILGILGDLFESSMKRLCNIKDSGKLLPGHGGILDRFDSTLLAIVFYKYILLLQVVNVVMSKEDEKEWSPSSSSSYSFLLSLLKHQQS